MTTERIDGPTPAGGAYALALFSDEPGVAVEKRQATRVTITEYEAEGNRLAETHGGVPAQRVVDAERGASRFTAPTPGGASRSAGRRRAASTTRPDGRSS